MDHLSEYMQGYTDGYEAGAQSEREHAEKRYLHDMDELQKMLVSIYSVPQQMIEGAIECMNYYHRNGIEVMDVIKMMNQFFGSAMSGVEHGYIFNVIKYLMRYKFKEDPVKDLNKAKVYIDYLIEEVGDE